MRIFCENSQKSIIIPSPIIRINSSTQTNYRLRKKSQSETSPKQMKWNPRRPENMNQGAYQQTTRISGRLLVPWIPALVISLFCWCCIISYITNIDGAGMGKERQKQEFSQLRMLLQEGDGLVPELNTTPALMKDSEDNHFAQFQRETISRKKLMKAKDKNCA